MISDYGGRGVGALVEEWGGGGGGARGHGPT